MEKDASGTSNLSSQPKSRRRTRRRRRGACCPFYRVFTDDLKPGANIRRLPVRWRPVVYCCSFAIAFYCFLLVTTNNNNGCLASGIHERNQEEALDSLASGMDTVADNIRQQYLKNTSDFRVTMPDGQKSGKI